MLSKNSWAAGDDARFAPGGQYASGGANCQGGAEREDRPGLAYKYGVGVADPQEHDATATTDKFLNAFHDA